MMGIINNLFLMMMGDKKQSVMEALGLESEYDPEVAYPEEEFQRLMDACCNALNISAEELQERFAKFVIPVLKEKFPGYFEAKSVKDFIAQIPTAHGLVTTAGTPPKIMVVKNTDNESIMLYSSPNKLCVMAKALLKEVLTLYGKTGEIEEKECMKKADDYCKIIIKY